MAKARLAAELCGYKTPDVLWFGRVIDTLGPHHKALTFRYVPDVEVINLPKPEITLIVIAENLDAVEEQFDVWGGNLTAP